MSDQQANVESTGSNRNSDSARGRYRGSRSRRPQTAREPHFGPDPSVHTSPHFGPGPSVHPTSTDQSHDSQRPGEPRRNRRHRGNGATQPVASVNSDNIVSGTQPRPPHRGNRSRGRSRGPSHFVGRTDGPSTCNKGTFSSTLNADDHTTSSFNPNAKAFIPRRVVLAESDVAVPSTQNQPRSTQERGRGTRGRGRGRGQGTNNFRGRGRNLRVHRNDDDSDKPLRERLINQLEDDSYECMICCQIVLARQGIWTCKTCYHMFHISGGCIVNWAKKSREDDNKWRCPACQTKYESIPYNYYCFCGKDRNPTTHMGDTPHSCGNVCGGQRGPGCPHPCSEPCHPGPCPECPVMLTMTCKCGSSQKAVRCGGAVSVACAKVCDRPLACGIHVCKAICHEGPCEPCETPVNQDCFCGSETRSIPCREREAEKYACGNSCPGMYKCGKHKCENKCHSGSGDCGPCPQAPERIQRCPCGRSSLEEMGVSRTSCEDVVPTCERVCDKVLPCGNSNKPHRCRDMCHTGPCPPCPLDSCIVCRCKHTKLVVPCSSSEFHNFAGGENYICKKRCGIKMPCGVHKCGEQCCVQPDHSLCMKVCNKRLSCGLHTCESICHAGNCGRCLHAGFDEQFCECGRTMRAPPIPCGAPLPECDEPCSRRHPCNHPVIHKCHSEERCPPCTFLVEMPCHGNHEMRKNIPCHMDSVSCGRICGIELPCGAHTCNRNCHTGECVEIGAKCSRPCPTLRSPCEHPCALPCHGLQPCPPSQCSFQVDVMCDCGRRKSKMKCHEVQKSMNRLRAVLAETALTGTAAESERLPVPTGILKRSTSMEKLSCMSCNDECKKVARNKKLADALSIVTNDDGETDDPTITFTESMKSEIKMAPQFVAEIESIFSRLLETLRDATNCNNLMSHSFRPMPLEKRRFVHEYATFFGMETVSVDQAPKRSVIVTAKRGVSRVPLVLLTDLHKYPSVLKAPGPTTLRQNINDEIKKNAAIAAAVELAEDGESKLKPLRAETKAYKRVAPPTSVSKPAPLVQSNPFGVLCSDDEDACNSHRPTTDSENPAAAVTDQRDIDWWSDEEDKIPAKKVVEEDVPIGEELSSAVVTERHSVEVSDHTAEADVVAEIVDKICLSDLGI